MHPVDAYARAVIAGRAPAGKYHRLACARHLRDRRREGTRAFPYRFEPTLADRFYRFAERLKHYKGEWAGQYIRLEPHQKFRLGSLFGWVHVRTGLRRFRTSYDEIPRKNGKALALDTLVPTPRGFVAQGDLRVGDDVFGPDGRPTRVQWVSEVLHDRPCYRVVFSDGSSFVADRYHLWAVRDRGWENHRVVMTTEAMAATVRGGRRSTHREHRYSVHVCRPVEIPLRTDLPIDPYVLGVWLGDGSRGSNQITTADPGIVEAIRAAGEIVRPGVAKGAARSYSVGSGRRGQKDPRSLRYRLTQLGILTDKLIPDAYIWASIDQRLALLQGLMDTDGSVNLTGTRAIPQCEYTSTSQRLANDVATLIASLGMKPRINVGRAMLNGREIGPKYRVIFAASPDRPVFRLARKLARLTWRPQHRPRSRTRQIVAIEPCPSVPVRCIRVDREDGLYLIGDRFIATHNSLESAIKALYLTFFDGEPGAEGYCIATKREQSKIVFNDCKRLVLSSGLRSRITALTANLHRDATASKLEPLGADRDSTDGLNPYVVIIDEAHAMKARGMIDVMETATGARRQPVINWITTAGNDPRSPCGDQHDYACKVLDGVLVDETVFAFIAHADEGDDWTAETTWRKANPNFGVSVKPADLRALATKAIHMPAAAAAFKQKRLNIWVNVDAPWLSLDGWRAGQSSTWTLEDLTGEPCYIGIDLSSKIDLTAVVLVFPPTATRASWRIVPWCLTPADTLEERAHRDRAPYLVWVDQGFLRTNPGNRIDQDVVLDLVAEATRRFQVQQIGIDPYNAGNLVKELEAKGHTVVEIPQTFAQMNGPSKEFEADVLDGLVDAGGHPLMAWAISNVVVQRDGKDNIYPTKKRSRGRIDPVIGALLARKLAAIEAEPEPAYQMLVYGGPPS
jgi:phage terminase large subunit-like protein